MNLTMAYEKAETCRWDKLYNNSLQYKHKHDINKLMMNNKL